MVVIFLTPFSFSFSSVDPIDHVNLHGGFEFSETHLKVETAPVLTRIVESSFELLSVRISIFEGFTTKIN